MPWTHLARLVKLIPQGSLVILLGAPGSLKSTLALSWAYQLMPEEPVVLISLDTDSKTQGARLVSLLTDGSVPYEDVMGDSVPWAEYLGGYDLPMRVFDSPVTPEEVGEVLGACRELWGRPPALVVVDDVGKLRAGRDYEGTDATMLELHRAARKHGTVVLGLHHVHRGESANRNKAIKLADGKFTGEGEAEIVLGAWRPDDGSRMGWTSSELNISVLKNRFGVDNPTGSLFARLHADPARVQITDGADA